MQLEIFNKYMYLKLRFIKDKLLQYINTKKKKSIKILFNNRLVLNNFFF